MSDVVPQPKAAAFFDVDNTLLRGASLYFLARGLARRNLITARQIRRYALKQWKYLWSGKEHLKDLKFVTEASMAFIGGREASLLQEIVRDVVDEIMLHKLWPGTLKIAHSHLLAGQEVWLVTAAPDELARELARRLELTGGVGTKAEVVDGRYTGHLVGAPLHGRAKADVVRTIAEERGLDLASCTAYSDSSNDLPMLTVVGNSVAVNPDAWLRHEARRQGWLTIEFRRRRFWHGSPSPANPNAAVGAGIAAGLAEAALERNRRK